MKKNRPGVYEVLEVRRAQYVVEMEGDNETGRMQERVLKCFKGHLGGSVG